MMNIKMIVAAWVLSSVAGLASAEGYVPPSFKRDIDPVDVQIFSMHDIPVPVCKDTGAVTSIQWAIRDRDWPKVAGWADKGECIFVNGTSWGRAEAASIDDGLMLSVAFVFAQEVDMVTGVLHDHENIGPFWIDTMYLRTFGGKHAVHDIAHAPFFPGE